MANDSEASAAGSGLRAWIGAWQPFTGGGVAEFARTSLGRLVLVQVIFALGVAAAVLLSLQLAWVPAIKDALANLPSEGAEIRAGHLVWPEGKARLLSERRQLSIGIDPGETATLGQNSDVQIELRSTDWRFRGLMGYVAISYPAEGTLLLTKTGATAAWDAWRMPLAAGIAFAVVAIQLLLGWTLATIYFLPVWAFAAICGRSPGAGGAWKLAAAGLLLASLLPAAGLLLYATSALNLPLLGGVAAGSIVAGWVWILWGILELEGRQPKATATASAKKTRKNPFAET